MYELLYYKDAVAFLNKNKQIKEKIKEKLSALKDWPIEINNIKALSGEYKGYYRFRIGKVRVIFFVDKTNERIFIDSIGFRGDVY